MFKWLHETYINIKEAMYSDRLNTLELSSILIEVVGVLLISTSLVSSNWGVFFISGVVVLCAGIIIEKLVYVVEEIRIASPVWQKAIEEAKMEEEEGDV